ncbi:putative transmembrane protein [Gregarina niphandrodes]|uniref:Transmembrane protein n=1 Tax=Gregarina niphandrodes TaxID=110365 RepID=A0A023B163_GRENI|nr:putative transmembrane protein [Gregarina niphandrodes]EZG46748.1 putative transmembrane protein [Gregarina niphandrodes]|eukprot:XP_011132257.1 putative transmembrane protein [Gregarina niphandrodes]
MGSHWQSGDAKTQAARIIHILASLLTLVVGLIHVLQKKPRVHWPDKFTDDLNAATWRATMFSLAPLVLVDNWTAVAMGIWGLLAHMKQAGSFLGAPTVDMLNAGVYLVIMGLWATIAYAGGIGVIFSCVTFLGALVCLILAFVDNQSASLALN